MSGEYLYALVISQLSRRFECCINKALEDMDLTQSQLRVLLCIYENEVNGGGRLFQKDIERVLMLSNPAVTGIVQRLESKGLIERKVAFSDRSMVNYMDVAHHRKVTQACYQAGRAEKRA